MSALIVEAPALPRATPDQRRGDPFANLKGHKFMNLTTFRKNGHAVVTPVWFVLTAGRVYMVTGVATGKVKRIRHTQRVLVGPSTANGQPLGPTVTAEARVLPATEWLLAHQALAAKYGWQWRLVEWWYRVRHQDAIFLEIVDAPSAAL